MTALGGVPPGYLSEDADPRLPHPDYPVTMLRKLHDPSVTFEEYIHYASLTRAEERTESDSAINRGNEAGFLRRFRKNDSLDAPNGPPISDVATSRDHSSDDEKLDHEKTGSSASPTLPESHAAAIITTDEWEQASRAARTASWGAIFYLITTDILGPFTAPWAMSQLGYGPGAALYTVFGAFAGYGGYLLWRIFMGLDSHRYPLKSYGDIAYRIYGKIARHSINVLQSIQLLISVSLIIIGNGQALSQIDKGRLCFIIGCFVWAIAGGIVSQIRTLKNLGWLAHFAIWLNVIIIISTMAVVAHTPPDFVVAAAQGIPAGPVVHSAGSPAGIPFNGQLVGLMQAVFSFGGAMLFVEFMAEMKRPWDFWKGMLSAQVFIYVVYMFFGLFVYSQQGQFTYIIAYQGISSYAWQTVANTFGLVSGLIAALLYGNIGMKVIYNNVLVDLFSAPPLETTRGKWIWVVFGPMYWAFAFVVGGAIPQIANLQSFIGALGILQFCYTFPPILMVGYLCQTDSMLEGDGFDVTTGQTIRRDGGLKRMWRGYKKQLVFNTLNMLFFLGSAVTAVLGIYSSVLGMIAAYKNVNLVSFSCNSPVG